MVESFRRTIGGPHGASFDTPASLVAHAFGRPQDFMPTFDNLHTAVKVRRSYYSPLPSDVSAGDRVTSRLVFSG